uniref:Uncharacterized protein n=1 Tax=Panagrolaimus sp. PS1159 TaxID=55785 RepID=A0AC35GRQ2_9BILA
MEMILFAALFVIAVNSYSIRPSKHSFDLLLPFNNPQIYYRSLGGERAFKRSAADEDDQKIASLIYNILYDTDGEEVTNNHKIKRDAELFSGQKRQSLRKSNFDILAGGGLGK